MAWVEKLPGKPVRYRGGWRDTEGRKVYTNRRTHPEHPYARKSDALHAAQEAETRGRRVAAVASGTLAASIPWGEWWDLSRPERPDSDTGLSEHYVVTKFIRPKWGATPLNTIKRKAVKDWVVKELTPGRAARYVRRIYAVFQASLTRAVAEEVLDASPCVKIPLPAVNRRVKPYADETHLGDLAQVNARGRAHLRDPAQRDLLDVGYETGLRPGELCGMHAHQLDLDSGWLDVTHVYISRQGVIRPWPKDKDHRRVPLTAKATEILRKHTAGREDVGCGVPHTDGEKCTGRLVFLNKRGGAITPRALYQAMQKAAKRAGVPPRSPYAVRRGFATWAAEGLDPFALAGIMGHADLDQTAEYVQLTAAARDRLRAARGEPVGLSVVEGDGAERHAGDDEERQGAAG